MMIKKSHYLLCKKKINFKFVYEFHTYLYNEEHVVSSND